MTIRQLIGDGAIVLTYLHLCNFALSPLPFYVCWPLYLLIDNFSYKILAVTEELLRQGIRYNEIQMLLCSLLKPRY